ncbi:hypothetical protein J6590_012773 [Homalodisca vitripennis]|nr:hypothetical protein J6590_012773 [Homalodisca vitripennis]
MTYDKGFFVNGAERLLGGKCNNDDTAGSLQHRKILKRNAYEPCMRNVTAGQINMVQQSKGAECKKCREAQIIIVQWVGGSGVAL